MGDRIDKLPTDDTTTVSKSDIDMIGALFQNKEQTSKLTNEFKDPIIGGLLFVVLSSHPIDKLIRSTGCTNEVYVWSIKLLTFIILFYILKNRFN